MVSLSTRKAAIDAVLHARDVTFAAYLLPTGAMRRALEAAARGGALVRVRLESRPYGDGARGIARLNKQAIKELRACGIDAQLAGADSSTLHIKGLLCDGVAYLDDRNWTAGSDQTIVRDDFPADVRHIGNAVLNDDPQCARFLSTRKDAGLAKEAALVRKARTGDTVEIESEYFGGSAVSVALRDAANRGVRCKLQVDSQHVSRRERATLAHLAAGGVKVRLAKCAEKFAVINETRAWVGSANATYGDDGERDWSLRTNDAAIIRYLHRNFRRTWKTGTTVLQSTQR